MSVVEQSLGEFEQLVLLAILRVGDSAYAVSIADEIAARTERAVSLGAVYKTLERLEDKGLVMSWIGAPTAERGGRRKKHYRLAAAGQRALKQGVGDLRRMLSGLEPGLRL
jgi:DNA-binding PadR family transcriptional regulator